MKFLSISIAALFIQGYNSQLHTQKKLIDYGNRNRGYGQGNHYTGTNNRWVGDQNQIVGRSNSVYGSENDVAGTANDVDGADNTVDGLNNAIEGSGNQVSGTGNVVIGTGNIVGGLDDIDFDIENQFPAWMRDSNKKGQQLNRPSSTISRTKQAYLRNNGDSSSDSYERPRRRFRHQEYNDDYDYNSYREQLKNQINARFHDYQDPYQY